MLTLRNIIKKQGIIMKKILTVIYLFLLSSWGIADNHAPAFGGIETYSCNFNEGNDLGDVLAVAKKWNKFASKNFSMHYQGYVLTPYYRDANTQHDFHWVGVSPSFEAQGKVADDWLAKGSKMQAEFDSVSTCNALAQWGNMPVSLPEDGVPNEGFVSFQACNMKEGASLEKMLEADMKMAAFAKKAGISSGVMSRWFPISGQAADFSADFIVTRGIGSLGERGKLVDTMIKSGGMQMQNSLYGELQECRGGPTSMFVSVGGKEE